jgi:hypothetical protein
MKTAQSKVEIQLKNQSTIALNVQYFVMEQEGFDAKLLMNQNKTAFLFEKNHQSIITTINLTKVTPYVILQFNEHKEFTGATFSLNTGQSPFEIKAMAEHFLLLPYPLAFDLQEVKSIS